MSNFLNNFSDDNYKKNTGDGKLQNQISSNKVSSVDTEKEILIEQDKPDAKSTFNLSGAAFNPEKLEIDQGYNEYLFKRTVVVCGTILIIVILSFLMYIWSHQTIAIDLAGKSVEEATSWLERENVNYEFITEESNLVANGNVIKQTIPSGEKITHNDLQTVTISSGPNMSEVISLEELKGKSQKEIEKFIDVNNLPNASIKTEYDDQVKKGLLIRTEFEDELVDETNYTRNDNVSFIISLGSKSNVKNLKMENFINQKKDLVYEWVGDSGVMIDELLVVSEKPEGYIVNQSIEPGEMIGYGDVLAIEVSKGSGELVPNLVGYTLDEAQEIADESNLTIESSEVYSNSKNGIVVSQSLMSDSVFFPEEDSMKISVSLGQPFISDMVGATVGEFVMAIQEINKQGANLFYTTTEVEITKKEEDAGIKSGTIKSQSISNDFAEVGSTINIEVYK